MLDKTKIIIGHFPDVYPIAIFLRWPLLIHVNSALWDNKSSLLFVSYEIEFFIYGNFQLHEILLDRVKSV